MKTKFTHASVLFVRYVLLVFVLLCCVMGGEVMGQNVVVKVSVSPATVTACSTATYTYSGTITNKTSVPQSGTLVVARNPNGPIYFTSAPSILVGANTNGVFTNLAVNSSVNFSFT